MADRMYTFSVWKGKAYDNKCWFIISGVAYVQYKLPQLAAYAKDKLSFLEYPPGYRIAVRYQEAYTPYRFVTSPGLLLIKDIWTSGKYSIIISVLIAISQMISAFLPDYCQVIFN